MSKKNCMCGKGMCGIYVNKKKEKQFVWSSSFCEFFSTQIVNSCFEWKKKMFNKKRELGEIVGVCCGPARCGKELANLKIDGSVNT